MKGWISLHRKMLENPILTSGKQHSRKEAWIWLLLSVNHKESQVLIGNDLVSVGIGEKITSLKKLEKQFNWGNTKVRNYLQLLQKNNMIRYESNTLYTKIHVCKFEEYQKTNTQTTQQQHTGNKRTHTNNNVLNNVKDNVDKRETKFINQVCAEGLKHTPSLHPKIIEAFSDYWTEKNRSKTKMRFELEKTFDIGRRLKTWIRNESMWDKNIEPEVKELTPKQKEEQRRRYEAFKATERKLANEKRF